MEMQAAAQAAAQAARQAAAYADAQAAEQTEMRAEIRALLDGQADAQAATLDALRALRDDVVTHDAEVVRVLELAVNVCEHVIECVDTDRVERRAIVDALTALTAAINWQSEGRLSAPKNGNGHVIGGRVVAGDQELLHEPVQMIELDDGRDTGVEVRCRFGDRWVDGFQVCETIHTDAGERYRLRRVLDGTILPELFAANDLRHIETFEELEPAPAPSDSGGGNPLRRIWSKL
jgi:hypothetical protein